jgi:hypothetical protein
MHPWNTSLTFFVFGLLASPSWHSRAFCPCKGDSTHPGSDKLKFLKVIGAEWAQKKGWQVNEDGDDGVLVRARWSERVFCVFSIPLRSLTICRGFASLEISFLQCAAMHFKHVQNPEDSFTPHREVFLCLFGHKRRKSSILQPKIFALIIDDNKFKNFQASGP